MDLKALTQESREILGRKRLMLMIMSGSIEPAIYYRYLVNQFQNYRALELCLDMCGFDKGYSGVYRTTRILRDIWELEQKFGLTYNADHLTKSTIEYCSHVEQLARVGDIDGLIAHLYVRQFADMYHGPRVASRVPGSAAIYDFDYKETLKTELRTVLSNDMATESNLCFDYAIRLSDELAGH